MNLDELRSVRRTERQKDSLQHLRDSFYADVADYIAELKAERTRAADDAADPFSDPDVGRLTDEIETAEDVVEAIYERRVGKVVKLASFAAADMSADTNGLTAEERALFDDMVRRIKDNRRTVLDVLAGKRSVTPHETTEPTPTHDQGSGTDGAAAVRDAALASAPDADPDSATESDPDDGGTDVLAEAMGEGSSDPETSSVPGPSSNESANRRAVSDAGGVEDDRPADEAAAAAGSDDAPEAETGTERVTLRITSDVGRIFGVDEREYDLAREDVVTLPTTNADPLVERGAAERLD
jgi:DNA replication factor GINS